jgi:hypothetical protein
MNRLVAVGTLLALSALPVLAQGATPTPAGGQAQVAPATCPAAGTCPVTATGGAAQTGTRARLQQHSQAFVDADGDGVCDAAATGNGQAATGRQGRGQGQRGGTGSGFVDVNGDGICDPAAAAQSSAAAKITTRPRTQARTGNR